MLDSAALNLVQLVLGQFALNPSLSDLHRPELTPDLCSRLSRSDQELGDAVGCQHREESPHITGGPGGAAILPLARSKRELDVSARPQAKKKRSLNGFLPSPMATG